MPEPHLRAADADRAEVAGVLGEHMTAGRLSVAEYDERLGRAYAARTYGDLAELTTDLPPIGRPSVARPSPQSPAQPEPARATGGSCGPWGHGWAGGWGHRGGNAGLRAAWTSWATTAVLVTSIWLLTSLGSGGWIYPWPIWVIGPWGAVLLAQTVGGDRGAGRDRRRDRRPEGRRR